MCYAVNELWLTLELIRISMLAYQVGSVIGDLCACLYIGVFVVCLCDYVCWYELCDGILMFSHMMVVIGDRHA